MEQLVFDASRRPVHLARLMAAALFMENLDSTVIVTALPQIARSFQSNAIDLNLGVLAYTLTIAIFVPISGWMADRFGARPVFAGALALFTVGSILCGLSSGEWSFVAFRVVQGIGGAMMMPVGRLALLRVTTPADMIATIARVAWPALVAPVLGPPVGGFIASYLDWRWIFFLNVPLGVIGIALSLVLIDDQPGEKAQHFDWSGFLLCGSACALVTHGLHLLARDPTPWRPTASTIGLGLLLGALAIRRLRRIKGPLFDLDTLRIPTYSLALCSGSVFRMSVTAVPFLLPLMFQVGFGFDPFISGLLVFAVFAGSLAMKTTSTFALRRFGFRRVLIANGVLVTLSVGACAALTPETPYVLIAAVLFVGGLFRSLQFSALNSLGFADVPPERLSTANTLASVAQQLSLTLGVTVSVLALRLAALLHSHATAAPPAEDFRLAFLMLAALTAVSVLEALTLPPDAGALVSGHVTPPDCKE